MVAGIGKIVDPHLEHHVNVLLRDGTEIQIRRADLVKNSDGSFLVRDDAVMHVFPKKEVVAPPPEQRVFLSPVLRARIDEMQKV